MVGVGRVGAAAAGVLAGTVLAAVTIQRLGARVVDRMVAPHADYWGERAGAQRRPGSFTYVALGDSAAQGVGVSDPSRGYVGLVADRLERELARPGLVANLSVSGARAADVVAQQLPRYRALVQDAGPHLVTVVIGGNDVVLPGWSLARFAAAMETIARTIPPGSVLGEVPAFGYGMHERRARQATAVVQDVAQRHGHAVAPLHSHTAIRWPLRIVGDSSRDFFHPNERGYQIWADAVWTGVTASEQYRQLRESAVS